jgi:hypothetical protein
VTVFPLEGEEHCTVGGFPAHTTKYSLPEVEGACIHAYMTTCIHGTPQSESEGFLFHGASNAVGDTTL